MKKNKLGKTGIEVTELCIGTLIHGKLQANIPPEEGAVAIRKALELGINFVDTAQNYGTYTHVRIGTEGFDNIVIASKSQAVTEKDMLAAVEECLTGTGREYIDIFHMHMVRSPENMKDREGALNALVKCKKEGKIGFIGLSAHGVSGTAVALDYPEIEVVLPIVNRNGLGIIDGDLDQMLAVVGEMKKSDIGLYDMKPLGGGHLIDDIPASIDYVRSLGIFDSIAVGLKTPEEVEIMVGIFEGKQESIKKALEIGPIRAQQKRLLIYRTCQSCGNCVSTCAQGALFLGETSAEVIPEKCILCGYCASSCPVFAIRVV